VLTQSNSLKKTESSKDDINKTNTKVNRGVELMLRGGKNKKKKKPIHITLEKIISFFNTEIDIYFEFSLSLKKKK